MTTTKAIDRAAIEKVASELEKLEREAYADIPDRKIPAHNYELGKWMAFDSALNLLRAAMKEDK